MLPVLQVDAAPEAPVDLIEATRAVGREAARLLAALQRLAADREQLAPESARAFADTRGEMTALSRVLQEAGAAVQERLSALGECRKAAGSRLVAACGETIGAALSDATALDGGLTAVRQELDTLRAVAPGRAGSLTAYLGASTEVLRLIERGTYGLAREMAKLEDQVAAQAEGYRLTASRQNRALAIHANNAGCRALQGGSLPAAEKQFRKALQLHPAPTPLFNLALVLVLAGRTDEARQLLAQPLFGQCDLPDVQGLKSLIALQTRDHQLALREAEAGLQICPDHPLLRRLAATAALATAHEAAALRYLAASPHAAHPAPPQDPQANLLDALASALPQTAP